MDQEKFILVQKSFRQVAPIADAVGATFCDGLFDTKAERRTLSEEGFDARGRRRR
jgi:hypothetical protein